MAKLPIGIVDTNRIVHNLINLADQKIAARENMKLNNELSSIYQRVNNFNRLLASQAPYIAGRVSDLTRKVGESMKHNNPVRPHYGSSVLPMEIKPYDLIKATDNTRSSCFLHSTEEMYSWFRFQVSFPVFNEADSIVEKRDQYISALAWSTLAYIKNYDVDYIDAAVDFALEELNATSQIDFSTRLQRRMHLIHSESLAGGHHWIQGVLKYHAKYDSSMSVAPQLRSLPDMSIVGIVARNYEFDLVNKKSVSKEESIAVADTHHPMNQTKCRLPPKVLEMVNYNQTPSMSR
ncbi:hypothetical protein HNW13_018170 [Shewanella sp. BF02_Schw]|uniref:hypothetical protein n=1 Tax=Shewanella sp. BF02_Schw TaxID=394908 RepID=UPI00178077F2|nr:hypothetical protein [Shewanella sp. BF02_Schw]MBO1897667.1 hypothetical protein [Shewanella sp. BF02_Schw]